MKTRPTSVTVIAWILIIMGGISLIVTIATVNNPITQELMSKTPIPIPIQYAMYYVGLLIVVICGIAMLKGCNWARILYVGWSVFAFVVGLATSPMKAAMIPGIVFLIIVSFFLFRPKANEYFSSGEPINDSQGA